jgi:peptidyl-prolyl cis-trans isomerase SurA
MAKQSVLTSAFAGFVLLSGALLWATPAAAEVSDFDSIVAVVNDDVITRSELETELDELLLQINADPARLPPRRVLEGQVLERIIADRLQLQAAEQAGIGVDDQTLAQAINNIASNNDLTLAELRTAMAADGMDFAQFRESVRKEIILSRLRNQEVINRINVSEQEIDNFLKKELVGTGGRTEYRLYHIRMGLPEAATPDEIRRTRARAEELVARLRAGGDFQQAAMTYSDGRQALEGGDLGWRKANELPTLFTDIVVEMQRGEISDPVQSASGFHIILLADYKGSDRQIIRQTHARHILINTNEMTSDTDARLRLAQLKQRIEGGDDFGALARSNSDDTASAIKGGDLGWVSGGDLVPAFEERMNALNPGQISEPFRTQFGWHIVQVIERRDYDNTNEVLRAKAREAIRERKANEAGELWLRRLRDEAYVEIRLDAEPI